MSEEREAEVADDEETEEVPEEADEVEETEDEAQEGLQSGDFVRLDYTARTVDDGDVVDTTDPEVAEEEGLDEEEREFEPRTIVLGEGHIFESVEDGIVGEDVGHSGDVTVPAGEAFGEYDPEEVQTVSADKIPEDERYPGAHVNVDGDHGHVETIIGGRARVDFNHPLAGEDIEYEYEVVGEVEDRVEKAQGLISMFIDADLDMWVQTDEVEEEQVVEPDEDEDAEPTTETETVEKETLYIESTPQLSMNQQWMFQKQQIAQQVMDQLGLDRVVVQETIEGGGMGPMGGMMGGGAGGADLEEALEDADVDEDEIVEELEAAGEGDAEAEQTEE